MVLSAVGFDGSVNEVQDARRSAFLGNSLPAVAGHNDLNVTIDTGLARTVRVAAGDAWVPGVMITNSAAANVTFDVVPIAGQKRWDALVLRVDWSANTVSLIKVNGTAAAAPPEVLPSGLTYTPGVLYDYVLALVQLTAGQTTVSALTPWRMFSTRVYAADTLAALHNAPRGTEVVLPNGKRYRYQLDATSNLAWMQQDMPTIISTGVLTPSAGWSLSSTYPCRCLVDATGTRVQYDLTVRRSGTPLRFGVEGGLADSALGTVSGPRPDGPAAAQVTFRCSGGATSTSLGGTIAFGYLNSAGSLILESGIPNNYVPTRAGAGDWSLQTKLMFTRGS